MPTYLHNPSIGAFPSLKLREEGGYPFIAGGRVSHPEGGRREGFPMVRGRREGIPMGNVGGKASPWGK